MRQLTVVWIMFFISACATFTPVPNSDVKTAVQSGAYSLDESHAALTFEISHFGISSYLGRFNDIEATLDIDQSNPEAARLIFTANIASLDINNESFQKTLLGADWFDANNHPTARFVSKEIIRDGEKSGTISGDLMIKGTTKPVSFDVQFNGGLKNPLSRKHTLGFEAIGQIKRSDFGITKYLSIAGDKFNFDTVSIKFNGEFQKN